MMRRAWFRFLGRASLLSGLLFIVASVSAVPLPRVLFINPGEQSTSRTGHFWENNIAVMEATGQQLGLTLDVRYGERNYIYTREIFDEAMQQRPLPDYLILVNDKNAVMPMLEKAIQLHIPTWVYANGISAQQKASLAEQYPEQVKYFQGNIIADNQLAGELLTTNLIASGHQKWPKQRLAMVALNGNQSTPAAMKRLIGLRHVLDNEPAVQLYDIVDVEWDEQRARAYIRNVLKRIPDLRLIWCSSVSILKGATQALHDAGKQPGKDVLLGVIGWERPSEQLLRSGELNNMLGGHFLLGAVIMHQIYDYHYHHKRFTNLRPIPVFANIQEYNLPAEFAIDNPLFWQQTDFTVRQFSGEPGVPLPLLPIIKAADEAWQSSAVKAQLSQQKSIYLKHQ